MRSTPKGDLSEWGTGGWRGKARKRVTAKVRNNAQERTESQPLVHAVLADFTI